MFKSKSDIMKIVLLAIVVSLCRAYDLFDIRDSEGQNLGKRSTIDSEAGQNIKYPFKRFMVQNAILTGKRNFKNDDQNVWGKRQNFLKGRNLGGHDDSGERRRQNPWFFGQKGKRSESQNFKLK
ncbi:uncharacterized protein LOC114544428 [Dendronephthya gigantea]|uniref:uncharacterized protein LOC114521999 n=1 Tax=Dendronephthya gigantea TaxID=151771 RepID=UPI00106AFBC3|nr:uncharacterized protein LOC114521999 [Dendronephthya gigantea]XP_028418878.1 uncharacterized protein LOC114544428 [Dendronephthya gigantea]